MSRIVLVNQSSTPDDAGSGNAQLFVEGNELFRQVGTSSSVKVADQDMITTNSTFTSPLSTPSVSAINTCKAWAKIQGTSTPALDDSFNVASITDTATGRFGVNFIIDMPDVEYCVVVSNGDNSVNTNRNIWSSVANQAAGSFEINCYNGSNIDPDNVYCIVVDK